MPYLYEIIEYRPIKKRQGLPFRRFNLTENPSELRARVQAKYDFQNTMKPRVV